MSCMSLVNAVLVEYYLYLAVTFAVYNKYYTTRNSNKY